LPEFAPAARTSLRDTSGRHAKEAAPRDPTKKIDPCYASETLAGTARVDLQILKFQNAVI